MNDLRVDPQRPADPAAERERRAQRISLWALVVTAVLVGVFFFRVLQPFLMPVFFAAVVAVVCQPLYLRIARWLRGRHRAAAATAALFSLLVLACVAWAVFAAGGQLLQVAEQLSETNASQSGLREQIAALSEEFVPEAWREDLRQSMESSIRSAAQNVVRLTDDVVANVVEFLVGVAIAVFALYYFLSEGEEMLDVCRALSPLEAADEEQLFTEFGRVCRGVVLGTLACALAQAALMGAGVAIVGMEGIWLFAALTFVSSMVPIVGAGAVWGPLALWKFWQGDFTVGMFIALYGACVVSTADNLVRTYVIHGATRLHPLVALISVIGGLRVVGLWGVLIGPITAAVFYTVLQILHRRLQRDGDPSDQPVITPGETTGPASAANKQRPVEQSPGISDP